MRFAVAIAALAACGSSDHASGPVALTAIAQRTHQAQCQYQVRCGMSPSFALCEQGTFGPLFAYDESPSLVAAVQAGELEYDQAAMTACIDAIANNSCDSYDGNGFVFPPECLVPAFHGTVPDGGACTYLPSFPPTSNEVGFVTECVSQQCNYTCDQGPDTCCRGTCVGDTPPSYDPIAVGQPCGGVLDVPCVDGAYCDNSMIPIVCRAQQPQGATCNIDRECTAGTACVGTPRTCEPLPALGEACPDGRCRDNGTYCNSSGTCAPVGLPGDPCMTAQDCGTPWLCDATKHVCTRPPITGEPCTNVCYDASYCAGGTCHALEGNGSPCADGKQCLTGYCGSTGVCEAPGVCI